MKWIVPPPALGFIAALAAGCNMPFLLSGPPPARPPSFAEIAAKQKHEDAARRQTASASPNSVPPAQAAADMARSATMRSRGDAAAGYGPRLARMLARDELEKLAA